MTVFSLFDTSEPAAPSPQAVDRYLAGEASPAEHAEVEAWLAARPAARAMTEQLVAVASAPRGLVTPAQIDATMSAIYARIARDGAAALPRAQASVPSRTSPRDPSSGTRRFLQPSRAFYGMSAAALCVIAGLAWWRSSAPRLDGPMSAARTYATQAAQRATIELPNGSRAILAPNTQLAVQTGARGDVVVTLRGQAFFTVAHAAERAFVVRTGAVETRVLGTAFDVRHYATDSLVEVAVVNGKVQTGTPVRSIVLTTGTVGRATDSTAAATSVRDISTYTSWTDGRLVFVDAPIPSMLTTIERWSGYRFRVADSTLRARLDAQHVTTDLMVGDPRGMLTMLQDILDVSLRVTGDTVTLSPRRRTPVLREGPRATPRTLSRPDGFSLSPEVGK